MAKSIDKYLEKTIDLTGADYFEYQQKIVKQKQAAADEWVLFKAYGLTAQEVNMELTFGDRVKLDKHLNAVPEGYELTTKELKGATYPLFKQKLSKDATDALRWLSEQMYLVNGEPVKDWATVPYGVANQMIVEASAFF